MRTLAVVLETIDCINRIDRKPELGSNPKQDLHQCTEVAFRKMVAMKT